MAEAQGKPELRRSMKERLRAIPAADREAQSHAIRERLLALPVIQQARTVHCYVSSLPGEVDTRVLIAELLDRGARVGLPRVEQSGALTHYRIESLDHLIRGDFGIDEPDPAHAEPLDAALIDVVIVPGLAYDRRGHRLGRGGGMYDRLLAGLSTPGVAPAFACQIVDAVPRAAHDRRVDWVVTETEVIDTRPPERRTAGRE